MEYSWIMNNTAKFGMAAVAAVIIAFAIFAGSDSGKISASDQQAIDALHSASKIHQNELQGCKHAADFDKCLADLSK